MNMETIALIDSDGKIPYAQKIKKRTKYIWYGGCQYFRKTEYHGWQCYIVYFDGETKAVIEKSSGEQYLVEVDDEKFELKERTTKY